MKAVTSTIHKVFCKDCSYDNRSICKRFKPIINKFTGQESEGYPYGMYKSNNKNGDCKYFKKKWYKIFTKS